MRIIPYSATYRETWDRFLEGTRNGTFLLGRDFLDYHDVVFDDCSVLVYAEEAMVDNADIPLGTDGLVALFPANWSAQEKRVYTHQALGYGGLLVNVDLKLHDVMEISQALFTYYANYLQAEEMVYAPLPFIFNEYPNGDELYSLFQAGAKLLRRTVNMVVPLKDQHRLPSLKNALARKAIERQMYISRLQEDDVETMEQYVSLLQDETAILSLSTFSRARSVEAIQGLIHSNSRFARYFMVKDPNGLQAGCMVLVTERVAYIRQLVCTEYGRQNGALELLLKHLTDDKFGGVKYLDMGSSYKDHRLDNTLLHAKEGFGGKAVCYDTYVLRLDNLAIDKMSVRTPSSEDERLPYLDLKLLNDSFEPALSEAVAKTVSSGRYLLGENVRAFEQEFAQYCGAQHCVAVGNGLEALQLILMAYKEKEGWNDGDEVIVPANTFIASILAISKAGLTPVLCDPKTEDGLLNPALVPALITTRTRAIMAVHLYGKLCDMAALRSVADEHQLRLIEDSAQAHGAMTADGRRAGHLGDASGFSFYPGKNLGALGDAGAVVTDDDELARMVRMMANYGSEQKYVHDYAGINSRMDEVQASVLRVKLKRLDADNECRRALADYYRQEINNPLVSMLAKPKCGTEHVYHIFAIRCLERDALRKYLEQQGVETLIHYPIPPYRQKAYEGLAHQSLPVSELLHKEILSLPLSPMLTEAQLDKVVRAINAFNVPDSDNDDA